MDTHLTVQLYLSWIYRIDHLGDILMDRPIRLSYHSEGLLCTDTEKYFIFSLYWHMRSTLYFQLGIIIIGTIGRYDYTYFVDHYELKEVKCPEKTHTLRKTGKSKCVWPHRLGCLSKYLYGKIHCCQYGRSGLGFPSLVLVVRC